MIPVSDEEVSFAEDYLSALKAGNLDDVKKYLDPQLKFSDIKDDLEDASGYFPKGEPIKVDLIKTYAVAAGTLWRAKISFQYEFSNAWVIAHVVLEKNQDKLFVSNFSVKQHPANIEEINAFNLNGKGASHYLFLAMAILIPLFILFTFILCILTPITERKWLWIVFVFIGFLGLTFNWTSGEIGFRPITVLPLGVKAVSGGAFSPWYITISFPLGAILFLLKRKKLSAVRDKP